MKMANFSFLLYFVGFWYVDFALCLLCTVGSDCCVVFRLYFIFMGNSVGSHTVY
jgi:hypothetical protein